MGRQKEFCKFSKPEANDFLERKELLRASLQLMGCVSWCQSFNLG